MDSMLEAVSYQKDLNTTAAYHGKSHNDLALAAALSHLQGVLQTLSQATKEGRNEEQQKANLMALAEKLQNFAEKMEKMLDTFNVKDGHPVIDRARADLRSTRMQARKLRDTIPLVPLIPALAPVIPNPPMSPVLPPGSHPGNFLFRMMEAVSEAGTTGSKAQLADAATTELNVTIETDIYNGWTSGSLAKDMSDINGIIAKIDAEEKKSDPNQSEIKGWEDDLNGYQSKFSEDQTSAQTNENNADRGVQTAQTQTGLLSSFVQQIAQLASSINQIASAMTNMLSR